MKNLSNDMKKATGWTGGNSNRICWCIAIKKKLWRRHIQGSKGSHQKRNMCTKHPPLHQRTRGEVDDDNVLGTRLVVNTSFELDNVCNNHEPLQSPPELLPLDIPHYHAQRNATEKTCVRR
jgi:hypothetical protein